MATAADALSINCEMRDVACTRPELFTPFPRVFRRPPRHRPPLAAVTCTCCYVNNISHMSLMRCILLANTPATPLIGVVTHVAAIELKKMSFLLSTDARRLHHRWPRRFTHSPTGNTPLFLENAYYQAFKLGNMTWSQRLSFPGYVNNT